MKKLTLCLITIWAFACSGKMEKMETAKIIEMVNFSINKGIDIEEGKSAMISLSDFVSKQPGFIGRKTSISEEGRFLDIVYWADLESALRASEKAMKDESLRRVFEIIDQESMVFQHYEIFHSK